MIGVPVEAARRAHARAAALALVAAAAAPGVACGQGGRRLPRTSTRHPPRVPHVRRVSPINLFTPTRGAYAETSLLASRASLGAKADFERFRQLLLGWLPVSSAVMVGARADLAASSEGTPFFLRPYVALRGVPAMRYQGDRVATLETEVRWQFHGRWSAVAFAGGGRTERRADDATRGVGSGGAGFRYELARRFGLHVGLDVARSIETTAVYLQVGNAWFHA